jgi:pimeloyl-ACP methyl ester carboxylesterase
MARLLSVTYLGDLYLSPGSLPIETEKGVSMRFTRTVRAAKRHPIRLIALAVVATLIPIAAMSAGPATAAGYPKPKPTIVLVHGAWADGSSWSGEISRLQHDGYTVDATPNLLRGLTFDTAYLKDILSTISGPIILVGHSYGGAVITNAATGNPNVKALVFVDAFAPDAGESISQLAGADSLFAPSLTDPTSVFKLVPYPGAPAGAVDTYILPNIFINQFANGIPRAQAKVLEASQRGTSTETFEPSGTPAWKTLPNYYLLGKRDNAITPPAQLFMAQRMHAQIVKINAGHLGLISNPGPVTDLIERAARAHG